MKIVHICQYYNDGYGYHENLLPQYQARLGHEVVIITSEREFSFRELKSEHRIKKPNTYLDGQVRIIRIPIVGEFKNRFVIFKNLAAVIENEKPDYLWHHGLTHPSIVTVAKYKQKHPSVFTVADNHSDLNNSARYLLWKLGYYNLFWRVVLSNCVKYLDIAFGVTPARCHFANEELGVPWSIIRLLPQGADEETARSIGAYAIKRDNLNRKLVLVTGGKINPNKNISSLFNAVTGLDIELCVFGALSPDIKTELSNSLPNNITFLGWLNREQTLKILVEADIAVWNRQHTNLIEDAIATLTPLILRYHGSTCYQIKDNGFYLYSDSSNEIRQYLQFLIRHREIILDMRNAADKMLHFLSYNRIAQESIDYYYDTSPKATHKIIMLDPMSSPRNKDFRKLI